MSHLEIIKFDQAGKLISVKSKEEKWENFPNLLLLRDVYIAKVKSYKNFQLREDDVFVSGFPRSGTTRLQELVWLILNDFDFKTALEYDSDSRCVLFECPELSFLYREKVFANSLSEMPSPRVMKTHLPVQLLPDDMWIKKPKIIYISRDVKDVVVSYWHMLTESLSTTLNFEEFAEEFLNDRVFYSPYRENLQNYLNIPDYENILYLTYEQMSADLDKTIIDVAKFLGKSVSNENLETLKKHLKFENMKKNNATNNEQFFAGIRAAKKLEDTSSNFIRKGVVGGYQDEMKQELVDRFNEWISESDNLNQGFSFKKV